MLTERVWTWEGASELGREVEKFERKPLGGVKGKSRVRETIPTRPEELVPMLPPLWLGSAG